MNEPIEQIYGRNQNDAVREERTACYNIARKVAHECGIRAKALHGVDDHKCQGMLEAQSAALEIATLILDRNDDGNPRSLLQS